MSRIETERNMLNHVDILYSTNTPSQTSTIIETPAFETDFNTKNPIENSKIHNDSTQSNSTQLKTPEEVIAPILDELIATEQSYIDILSNGIENYSRIFQRDDLPFELQGRQYELLANIEAIAKFHRDLLLPMFLENRANPKILFEKLQQFVEVSKKYVIYFHFF